MSKYTSLNVSGRLMEAGFTADIDGQHVVVVGDGLDHLPPGDRDEIANTERVPSYRADTLMEWLLAHKVAVFVDKRGDVYYVYPEEEDCFTSGSLPDALGEVILEALTKEVGE